MWCSEECGDVWSVQLVLSQITEGDKSSAISHSFSLNTTLHYTTQHDVR